MKHRMAGKLSAGIRVRLGARSTLSSADIAGQGFDGRTSFVFAKPFLVSPCEVRPPLLNKVVLLPTEVDFEEFATLAIQNLNRLPRNASLDKDERTNARSCAPCYLTT